MKKRGEKKYPGDLGKRPKPTDQDELVSGLAALANLSEGDIRSIQAKLQHDQWMECLPHELKGINLLCDHFGLSDQPDPAVKFLMLSILLARRHVPYFMHPTRRGPPNINLIVLPIVDALLEQDGMDLETVHKKLEGFVPGDLDTFGRELRQYRQNRNK